MRPHLAPFGTYVSGLLDTAGGLYTAEPDLTLCVLDAGVVFDEVPVPWRPADVERAAREKGALLRKLAAAFASAGRGTLVLNTVPLERGHAAQLVDHRSRARLGIIWREFNSELLELAAEQPGVVVLDIDPLVGVAGAAEDPRPSVYAKAHLPAAVLAAYAREVGHLARHLAGRTAKCLVLDLDGTLWGGTVGEDGPDGVQIGEGLRGGGLRRLSARPPPTRLPGRPARCYQQERLRRGSERAARPPGHGAARGGLRPGRRQLAAQTREP